MALTLLATATASTSSTIDFTSSIDSTYQVYELHCLNLHLTTDDDEVILRVSTDGGSTWKSGASDYDWGQVYSSTLPGNSAASSAIYMQPTTGGEGVGNATGEQSSITIYAFDPANASNYTLFTSRGVYIDRDSGTNVIMVGGGYMAATAVNGFRIATGAGSTIISGEFKLYGVQKS